MYKLTKALLEEADKHAYNATDAEGKPMKIVDLKDLEQICDKVVHEFHSAKKPEHKQARQFIKINDLEKRIAEAKQVIPTNGFQSGAVILMFPEQVVERYRRNSSGKWYMYSSTFAVNKHVKKYREKYGTTVRENVPTGE